MENILNCNTLNIFKKAIGEKTLKYFKKSNAIFSSIIYNPGKDEFIYKNKGNLILKNKSPKFIEDWIVYLIIRSHCQTWVTTRKMIEDEKHINTYHNFNFYGYTDIHNFFTRKRNDLDNMRNIVVLSNIISKEEIFSNQLFVEKDIKKFVKLNENIRRELIVNNEFSNFAKNNNIEFIVSNIDSMEDCLSYCKKSINANDSILIEAGESSRNYLTYKKGNKLIVDFLLLSVYQGELNEDALGSEFPSIENFTSMGLEVINISDKIKSEKGTLTFYSLVNKDLL